MRHKVAILGSTGSIGVSTLDVVRQNEDRLDVVALAAGRRIETLAEQVRAARPEVVSVADGAGARQLAELLSGETARPEILVGEEGACAVASAAGADVVVAAIVGAAGLSPTLRAVEAGANVGLANKEALVLAGALMLDAAQRSGATLLPIDSEHNAIHQCLRAGTRDEVARITLTASGGPFRGRSRRELERVRREDALAHPTWDMGPKITIDSATLMNKGLEVIEAHWLFDFDASEIDVVVHPQSIVHSFVEYRDGSVVAQMGNPDMRHPIQYALTWPERCDAAVDRLDLVRVGGLTFEAPDHEAFPCLGLAYRALSESGDAPTRLSAANEVAVEAFLQGEIAFVDIPRTVEAVLDGEPAQPIRDLEQIVEADRRARERARWVITKELSA